MDSTKRHGMRPVLSPPAPLAILRPNDKSTTLTYGPKHVGANYGIVFAARGLRGFVVPGYFARITDRARAAGNLAAGYNEIYLTLAAMAAVCALVVMLLRPPRAAAR